MDRRKLLFLALSLAFGIVSWAVASMVALLWWLPFVALPVAGTVMLLIGALLWFDHRNATRRRKLKGFGVHMILRVADVQKTRRQYIFDLGLPGGAGASFYLSASRRFVFLIRDALGESYSLEVMAGWLGFPIADAAYFGIEAGTDGIITVMRAMVNGRILHERTLPFAVDFTGLEMNDMTLGANRNKAEHGAFVVSELIFVGTTLDDSDARNLSYYMATKWSVPLGA